MLSTVKAKRHALAQAAVAAAASLSTGKPIAVPFSKLFLSPNNVRSKDAPSAEGIERLAAMIDADGLLNDLQVSVETVEGQATGRYAVEAGGRRWRALGLLVQRGRLSPEAPISCKLVEPEAARGVSLAENLGQEAMHPADEFQAFAQLVAEGKSPEDVAARFGVTVVHVQRRMKLAAVAPALLALYRQDKATLDHMIALASVDDHKRQLAVWKALPEYQRTPAVIRRKLLEEEVSATDERVRVITLPRYEASGGTLRRDLFTDEVFLTDPGLVDLVFAEVLAERSTAVEAEGWGWVEVLPTMTYEDRQRYVEPPAKYLPEDEPFRERLAALQTELQSLEDRLGDAYDQDESDDNDEKVRALETEANGVRRKLADLRQTLIDPAGYDKAELGAIVTVEDGKVKVLRGRMTADAARAARAHTTASAGATSDAGNKARPDLSEALMLSLSAHRTAAVQASLLTHQPVALAALAARLAEAALDFGVKSSSLQVSLTTNRSRIEQCAGGFAESRAGKALDAERARWAAVLPEDKSEWFDWLLAQPQETVLSLLTYCAALSVDAIEGRPAEHHPMDPLAKAVRLDMADWWEATDETYLGKVPKAKLIEAVTEACGAEAASELPKMKKGEAIAHARAKMSGTRWLPKPLKVR